MLLPVLVPRLSLSDYSVRRVIYTLVLMGVSIRINSNMLNRLPGQLQALAMLGKPRARSHCRVAQPLNQFISDSLTYSVLLFLKRQRDRTLGKPADYVWLTASATGARSALP